MNTFTLTHVSVHALLVQGGSITVILVTTAQTYSLESNTDFKGFGRTSEKQNQQEHISCKLGWLHRANS